MRPPGAIVIMLGFWHILHIAIPWIADAGYLLGRVISPTRAVAGFLTVFVLVHRRLMPLIAMHSIADASTALMVAVQIAVAQPRATRRPVSRQPAEAHLSVWAFSGACSAL